MCSEVVSDGTTQLGDVAEAGALESATGELGEEAFDLIEPGAVGGDEVEVPAWVAREPAYDQVGLVSGVVIEHRMDIQAGWSAILDLFEEGEELLVRVARVATAPDLAGGHIEGCEQ